MANPTVENGKAAGPARILMVGQTPPPFYGQAIATQILFEHEWAPMKVETVRMAYSSTMDDVGRFAVGKIFHLFGLIFRTWAGLIRLRGAVLYYLPAGGAFTPVMRDIVYLLAVRPFTKKTVFHFHAAGLPEFLEEHRFVRMLAKLAYWRPDVSVEIAESAQTPGDYLQARRRVVVRNGIPIPDIGRSEAARKRTTTRILYVGILSEGKGILELIKTARLLDQRGVDAEFEIVGEWWDDGIRREAEALIGEYGLGKRIHFAGFAMGDDKFRKFADSDLFFFPSHYENENFPLVLIEAMAFGLPVVTTEWRGIPELIVDGETGLLLPVKDPEAFAGAIERIINDPALAKTLGAAGRHVYESQYTGEVFFRNMRDVFEECWKEPA
ncbi:MAG: glycosyltransferase family 4 protein [Akkermansiaceae bacterium]|nr:glycosyltransferase family 4 protein [Akkermansiaceae bacterium]NNM29169.1 glycosyltransferase family 4 protein [Akkermansiaceae bacterium]